MEVDALNLNNKIPSLWAAETGCAYKSVQAYATAVQT